MIQSLRRAAARVAMCGLVGLALLPPEHVHLGEPDDHDGAGAVHRHFESHQRATGSTHVEHPDDDASYLDTVFDVADGLSLAAPEHSTLVAWWAPTVGLNARTPRGPDVRVHDPPWARSFAFRGPPLLAV